MQSFLQRHRVLFLHLSFWGVYFSFFFYQINFSKHGAEPNPWESLASAIFQVAAMMTISYLNYFLFLPRFLQHKNLGRYLLEFIGPFVLLITLFIHTKRFLIDGYTHEVKYFYSERFIVQSSVSAFFIVVFVSMLQFAQDWFELEARKREVENEKLMAELRFLKAQINPHFLFNTLNNLYYLAFTQSPNTTEVIARLSQMMRYMIHDSNQPRVRLRDEVTYMENYISLEKLRLNEQVPIVFEVKGNPDEVSIEPFILITFLENAFKHGVGNHFPGAWVTVRLEICEGKCIYEVANSKLPVQADPDGEKSGIGLQNVRRRLELSYQGRYELRVGDEADRYTIHLTLDL
ncbi:MAG: histidine kinase [Bacteroidia bacterium]|nr:histidine kinase [Bacteroidia bacterium]